MEKSWTSNDIRKVFRFDDNNISVQSLYSAEEKNIIPTAYREKRGKVNVRKWPNKQIPEIGEKFGFLKKPEEQVILCKYIQKGGVLKTTTTFNEARGLALHGIRVLVIGLDFECSITDVITDKHEITSLNDRPMPLGIYHLLVEKASLGEVVIKTELPTLDIIPETHDLVALDKWLNQQTRREYIFKDKVIPLLKDYDVIIFDNGPSWNHLIENSIVSSNAVICTLGCSLLAYNASETNLSSIFEFQEKMGLTKQKILMIPTLLERNSLSQQIYGQYLTKFEKYIIPLPIRTSVKGQEALVCKQTILEYAPTSQLAQDYYELIKALWEKVTNIGEI